MGCIPEKWKFIKQNDFFFFSALDNDKNSFFVVIKFNPKLEKKDGFQYLSEGHLQMQKDSVESLKKSTTKRISFKNKEAYYSEFTTIINKKEYFAYSMVFEWKGFVYDIALKVEKKNRIETKEIFQNILFNFWADDELIFNENDKINSIQEIDLLK